MKNYLIGTSLLLGTFVAPSFAEESKDFYLSIGGGLAFPSDVEGDTTISGTKIDVTFPTDDPFIYSLAIGKEFNDLRFEFNYSGTKLSSDSLRATALGTVATASITPDLELNAKSYMIYGYKDIPTESKFTPYFGVGLGTSTLSTEATNVSISGIDVTLPGSSESVFTYGIKGGIGYKIADNTSLYSEASYLNYASFSTDSNENYDSNNLFGITAGLRFNF